MPSKKAPLDALQKRRPSMPSFNASATSTKTTYASEAGSPRPSTRRAKFWEICRKHSNCLVFFMEFFFPGGLTFLQNESLRSRLVESSHTPECRNFFSAILVGFEPGSNKKVGKLELQQSRMVKRKPGFSSA